VITGRVASVRDFGAFVDIGGGVHGLLHVSEMGWSRVSDTSQLVKPGDEITVKVLRIDDDKQKISLGLKQLSDDPWSKVQTQYEPGQLRNGRVTRVAPFGIFVELEPGIEGLVPLSESGVPRDADVKKAFPSGARVEVVVLDIDAAGRKLRLSVTGVQRAKEVDEVREYNERDAKPSAEGFGSLAEKLRGALTPREK
jgi:small subunit ribosomal protein S1